MMNIVIYRRIHFQSDLFNHNEIGLETIQLHSTVVAKKFNKFYSGEKLVWSTFKDLEVKTFL